MPALGGAVGLWGWSFPIVFVTGALVLFTLGMASVATLTVGLAIIVLFTIRASMDLMPWVTVLYGIVAELLLIWALRPNIQKIFAGNERVINISLMGWLRSRKADADPGGRTKDSS
jgi:glycerol-3-phosphate acyltransferase PlsY